MILLFQSKFIISVNQEELGNFIKKVEKQTFRQSTKELYSFYQEKVLNIL